MRVWAFIQFLLVACEPPYYHRIMIVTDTDTDTDTDMICYGIDKVFLC